MHVKISGSCIYLFIYFADNYCVCNVGSDIASQGDKDNKVSPAGRELSNVGNSLNGAYVIHHGKERHQAVGVGYLEVVTSAASKS